MWRLLWLLVTIALLIGGAITLSLSALLAIGRWWYGFRDHDPRVGDWAEAGLVFWVLAGMARYAAGPGRPRPEVAGDYDRGDVGAVLDGRCGLGEPAGPGRAVTDE